MSLRLLLFAATALSLAHGAAYAQGRKDFEEFSAANRSGEIAGAESLSQCKFTPDERELFLSAVQRGVSSATYTSAEIQVMLNSQFQDFMKDLWRAVGVDVDNPSYSPSSYQTATNSHVETYNCGAKRWSADNDFDIIVVEYKKSAEARAREIRARQDADREGAVAGDRPQLPPHLNVGAPTTQEDAFDAADRRLIASLDKIRAARSAAEADFQDAKRNCPTPHCRAMARQTRTAEMDRLYAEEAAAQEGFQNDLRAIARYFTDLYSR